MREKSFKSVMVFIVLSASVAIAYQLPNLRYTFYDQMMAAYNINNTQIGLIATLTAFTNTICYPIGGIMADRIKAKPLIVITLTAFVLLTVWFAFTTNFITLLIIHTLYAFFGIATLWSVYLTSIRELGTDKTQSKIFGFSEATRGVIQTVCGFAYLGLMSVATTPAAGMHNLLFVGAGITVVFLILAIIFLPNGKEKAGESVGTGAEAVSGPAKNYTLKEVLTNKGVWITIMIIMCSYVFWTLGNGYLTTYTVQVLGIDTATASTIGIVRSYIIVLVAGVIGGVVLDRFTYKGLGFLTFFIISIALVAGVMLSSVAVTLCVVLTLCIALAANMMKSTYWSIMGQAGIPAGMTALATGIISFIAFIPDFVTPVICGIWLDDAVAVGNVSVGFMKIFALMIVFGAVGCIFSVILKHHTAKLRAAGEQV